MAPKSIPKWFSSLIDFCSENEGQDMNFVKDVVKRNWDAFKSQEESKKKPKKSPKKKSKVKSLCSAVDKLDDGGDIEMEDGEVQEFISAVKRQIDMLPQDLKGHVVDVPMRNEGSNEQADEVYNSCMDIITGLEEHPNTDETSKMTVSQLRERIEELYEMTQK